jgi:MraZ protein
MGQVPTNEVAEVGADSTLAAPPATPPRPRFTWEYRNGVDAKARVVLPAPYRPAFADGGYLTVWQDRCLAAMPAAEFDAYVTHLEGALAVSHEVEPDAILRELWRTTLDFRLDIQGRLSLAEPLREAVGLGREIRFVGFGRRVELWPADVTAEQEAERDDHRATISLLQSSYDVPRMGS